MAAEKKLARQDADFAINPGNNNETSIKVTNDIVGIFYDELPLETTRQKVSFYIYKEDFIKSACGIISSLPLLDKHGRPIAFSNELCNQLLSQINTFFGDDMEKLYHAELLFNTDRSSCLQRFEDSFNIRSYMVESWTTISFNKKSNGIHMRMIFSKSKESAKVYTLNEHAYLQQIFYGAPGTGKSYKIKSKLKEKNVAEENIFRTTFHPDYDYASFVGGYKPMKEDDKITYFFIPQVFTNAYVKAWNNLDKSVYLVIEEINRGNCAQIFGDLFQLLDRNETGKSDYPVDADVDLKNYLEDKLDADSEGIKEGKLCLPPNLNILATMNTSDQSLFPMDSAFKRRWDWEFVPINYCDADGINIEISEEEAYSWGTFIKKVNEKIKEATSSADKQLGNRFVRVDDSKKITLKQFVNKVMFYLWNDIYKDMEKGDDGYIFENVDSFESFFEPTDDNAESLVDGINKERVNKFITQFEGVVNLIAPKSGKDTPVEDK